MEDGRRHRDDAEEICRSGALWKMETAYDGAGWVFGYVVSGKCLVYTGNRRQNQFYEVNSFRTGH